MLDDEGEASQRVGRTRMFAFGLMSGEMCIQTDALSAHLVPIMEVLNEIELGDDVAQPYGAGLLLDRVIGEPRSEANTTAR